MSEKNFKLKADELKILIETKIAGIASDMIMVEGSKVGYIYREEPYDSYDNGWRFGKCQVS